MSLRAARTDSFETPLPDGASVGVIGAGPAGTFFALHLLSLLRAKGRTARVTLIDRKTFSHSGPSGCNMCAGAVGPALVKKIHNFSISFDDRVIRRIADGYEIHGRDVSVTVRHPERGEIYTVFRGGGPGLPGEDAKSFDQFLLDTATARGAEFFHERVESIEKTRAGYRLAFPGGTKRDFDFLVGAFGVNTSLSRRLPFDYRPPKTWHTVQAEIPAANEFIEERLRNRIHIVAAWGKAIRFLAITPKDNFLTLTGIGEHVKIADLESERSRNRALASLLPENAKVLCHCHPQVPIGVAVRPFSDRMAIIGDAFISRHLKNGIESSHDTARILAMAITSEGISGPALREHFYRPCLRLFRYDNVWGRVLFGIYESVLRKGRLSDAYLRSVNRESAEGRATQAGILWAVFAGDAPYREIAGEAFAPGSLWKLARNLMRGR
jgi:flavin-dependent dehydrogenase